MADKKYYVYIMANRRNGTLYTGVTGDIVQRVWQHKLKENKKSFTARYDCTMLVYTEDYQSITNAISREKQIKSHSRAYKIKLIESMNPTWADLAGTSEFWF